MKSPATVRLTRLSNWVISGRACQGFHGHNLSAEHFALGVTARQPGSLRLEWLIKQVEPTCSSDQRLNLGRLTRHDF